MTQSEQYLQRIVRLLKTRRYKRLNGYICVDDFILQHGKAMPVNGNLLPQGVERGPKGYCYFNAAELTRRDPCNFIYCEGYADGGAFPLLHAWCITRQGLVVDPTWETGTDYFGVAFRAIYLRRRLKIQERDFNYGLLQMHQYKYPVLRAKPSAWRHAVMDRL